MLLVGIPYKGAALVINDLVGGHLPVTFVTFPSALPHLRSGNIKVLAITSPTRAAGARNVPTMIEEGLPGLVYNDWAGILVRVGTPASIVDRLNRELVVVLHSPEVQQRFREQGIEPIGSTVAEFADTIRANRERLAGIIKQAGIRAD